VRRNLAAYQRDFFAWMEGALTVGNEQKAMSEAYAAIESALDTTLNYISQANASAEDENQNSRADIKFKLLIAMLLIAIAVSALSFWIARSITNPIRALTAGMRELANGNFDVVLFGLGRKDEIGDIAGAIETFKVKAAERAQIEAGEKAEQDKKAAAEREVAMQKMASEFEAAVGGIVQAAVAGDFTQRVDLNGKTGLVLNIGTALNSLCDNTARALDDLIKMLNALADGDLTPRITAEYQGNFAILKDNANKTAERIGATIGEIKQSAREVTNASAEISTSTTDLSQRTEEQAASLEETSASMEEISATVKKNAENAQQANASAGTTRDVADRGGQVVAKAVEAMAKIEDSSRKISDIIGVIDEIARQTNLLALNAAVEGARAGEAGRGFAVVASEVRSLAQRSSQAAKDIKDVITNSNGQVKDGVDLVNRAGIALTEIVESIKKVSDIVADIANASAEQATGIEQVNKALTQMDEVTQQNSALVEENAATAKTLEHQAKAMDERVAFFRLDAEAGHAAPSATAREQRQVAMPSRGPAAPKRLVAAPKRAAVGGRASRMAAISGS
jgi:methyl-accepting chemotaxis protein